MNMAQASTLVGKHVRYSIPRPPLGDVVQSNIEGSGVVVHYQPKDEPMPGPWVRKYYDLMDVDNLNQEFQKRLLPVDYNRIVVLDSFGAHTVIGEKSFPFVFWG